MDHFSFQLVTLGEVLMATVVCFVKPTQRTTGITPKWYPKHWKCGTNWSMKPVANYSGNLLMCVILNLQVSSSHICQNNDLINNSFFLSRKSGVLSVYFDPKVIAPVEKAMQQSNINYRKLDK